MEVYSSGGKLQVHRRGYTKIIELWRQVVDVSERKYGGMEAHCRCGDVEAKRDRDLELQRLSIDV